MKKHSPISTVLLTGIVALALLLNAFTQARSLDDGRAMGDSTRLKIVIDHDPMRMTVGSPLPMVGSSPIRVPRPRPAGPDKKTVTPDTALNQILVEQFTPINVSTGNTSQTGERLYLECYRSSGRHNGLLRLHRLKEGARGDYSISSPSVPVSHGGASFTVRFHRNVLGRPHALASRTVYLVTFKSTERYRDDGDDCIQTVTVLNDDPAAFRSAGHDSRNKE